MYCLEEVDLPHTDVIDPRTGMLVLKVVGKQDSAELICALEDFVHDNTWNEVHSLGGIYFCVFVGRLMIHERQGGDSRCQYFVRSRMDSIFFGT